MNLATEKWFTELMDWVAVSPEKVGEVLKAGRCGGDVACGGFSQRA
jgi:hypothetical protein